MTPAEGNDSNPELAELSQLYSDGVAWMVDVVDTAFDRLGFVPARGGPNAKVAFGGFRCCLSLAIVCQQALRDAISERRHSCVLGLLCRPMLEWHLRSICIRNDKGNPSSCDAAREPRRTKLRKTAPKGGWKPGIRDWIRTVIDLKAEDAMMLKFVCDRLERLHTQVHGNEAVFLVGASNLDAGVKYGNPILAEDMRMLCFASFGAGRQLFEMMKIEDAKFRELSSRKIACLRSVSALAVFPALE